VEQSEQINELAAALSKAQGQMTGALKDSANPFFKSKYADLAACWESARKPLADNGLAVIQATTDKDGTLYLVTTLAHSSGQWIKGWLPVKCKDDSPQAMGSGLTYARRYAFAGIAGIAQIDDDGEAAQGRTVSVTQMVANENPLSAKQLAYAKEFAESFRKTLNADVEDELKIAALINLKAEANEDHLVYTAAWDLLASSEKSAIKKLTAKKGAN
jgi:hypothetical protein